MLLLVAVCTVKSLRKNSFCESVKRSEEESSVSTGLGSVLFEPEVLPLAITGIKLSAIISFVF